MAQPTHKTVLVERTTVEAFAEALQVSLQDLLGHAEGLEKQSILTAIQPVTQEAQVRPFEALFVDKLRQLLGRIGVEVVGSRALSSAQAWAEEGKKYAVTAPKLDPRAHKKRAEALEKRLQEEAQYELKKKAEPRLVEAMRPLLRMTPPGL